MIVTDEKLAELERLAKLAVAELTVRCPGCAPEREHELDCPQYREAAVREERRREFRDALGLKTLHSIIAELRGLRSFKRSVDYALNSGDGSYRP